MAPLEYKGLARNLQVTSAFADLVAWGCGPRLAISIVALAMNEGAGQWMTAWAAPAVQTAPGFSRAPVTLELVTDSGSVTMGEVAARAPLRYFRDAFASDPVLVDRAIQLGARREGNRLVVGGGLLALNGSAAAALLQFVIAARRDAGLSSFSVGPTAIFLPFAVQKSRAPAGWSVWDVVPYLLRIARPGSYWYYYLRYLDAPEGECPAALPLGALKRNEWLSRNTGNVSSAAVYDRAIYDSNLVYAIRAVTLAQQQRQQQQHLQGVRVL